MVRQRSTRPRYDLNLFSLDKCSLIQARRPPERHKPMQLNRVSNKPTTPPFNQSIPRLMRARRNLTRPPHQHALLLITRERAQQSNFMKLRRESKRRRRLQRVLGGAGLAGARRRERRLRVVQRSQQRKLRQMSRRELRTSRMLRRKGLDAKPR